MFKELRRKYAEHSAEERKFREELYQIKYGHEKKPLATGKFYTNCFFVVCIILIFFIMFATIYLMDGQILIAMVGPIVSATIALISYQVKSTKENTEGGIQFERLKQDFESTKLKIESGDCNIEDAVG